VAKVALTHIAAVCRATQEEATWVLTSLLVAQRDHLRWLSGFDVIGRTRFYMIVCRAVHNGQQFSMRNRRHPGRDRVSAY